MDSSKPIPWEAKVNLQGLVGLLPSHSARPGCLPGMAFARDTA